MSVILFTLCGCNNDNALPRDKFIGEYELTVSGSVNYVNDDDWETFGTVTDKGTIIITADSTNVDRVIMRGYYEGSAVISGAGIVIERTDAVIDCEGKVITTNLRHQSGYIKGDVLTFKSDGDALIYFQETEKTFEGSCLLNNSAVKK